jgi:hypothetical protein
VSTEAGQVHVAELADVFVVGELLVAVAELADAFVVGSRLVAFLKAALAGL